MTALEEPEGATPLGSDEMAGLKFAHVTTRGELDELEQANIEQGLLWLSRQRGGDILDDAFARALHKRLFGDVWQWAGRFRSREMNIGVAPEHIAVQLRMLLENARVWVKCTTFPALEAAARFHHRMVEIHPFPNGNGRHARIAADVFLGQYFDHSPIEWADGFDLQAKNERRGIYIKALRLADRGEFDLLLEFVGAG